MVLTEIVLPNGLSYKFSYNIYGEIDKIIYPTGGYERCKFDPVPTLGTNSVPYTEASRGVTSRWVSPTGTGSDESQWQYEAAALGTSYMVKATAPDGTYTKSFRYNNVLSIDNKNFSYDDARNGMTYDEQVYDANNVMLRRALTEWDVTSANFTRPPQGTGTYTA